MYITMFALEKRSLTNKWKLSREMEEFKNVQWVKARPRAAFTASSASSADYKNNLGRFRIQCKTYLFDPNYILPWMQMRINSPDIFWTQSQVGGMHNKNSAVTEKFGTHDLDLKSITCRMGPVTWNIFLQETGNLRKYTDLFQASCTKGGVQVDHNLDLCRSQKLV